MAMLLAASYCVLKSSPPSWIAWGVAAASTFSAGALGYFFGGWYTPVAGERPSFELVAVPLSVSILAPVLGAVLFLLSGIIFAQPGLQDGVLWVAPMAVAMTLAYFTVTWPVAIAVFVLAGAALGMRSWRGSNQSFKPTPSARLNSRC